MIKVVKGNLEEKYGNSEMSIERYLKEQTAKEKQKNIESLIELLSVNPEITEDMVRENLKPYLGIAKREIKKKTLNRTRKIRK